MKYVGVIYKDVIIAKAKIYKDIVGETQIELTEEQYNTIITPCKLVDGVFVPCDFPEAEEKENPLIVTHTQIASYVGTGTWGADNPCSLTFDFAPRIIMYLGNSSSSYHYSYNGNFGIMFCEGLPTEYDDTNVGGFGFAVETSRRMAKKSADGKTVYWYADYDNTVWDGARYQLNMLGTTCYFIAIG